MPTPEPPHAHESTDAAEPRSLDVERERLALQHLEAALDWPLPEREARLQALLGDDPDLLHDVRELLNAATLGAESLPTRLPIAAFADEGPPPERVGAYRLGALLGTGGMGRVFRAERADGMFEQAVAIKLMRRALVAGVVGEQFARERQILARLRHRNIAQLYDGGVTPDGVPYFVMELVTGRHVTDYAAEKQLDVSATLQLFRQVCGAVRHAHSHLVVHADIKPSNVVVADDGTAKLLDFGVARALADAVDDAGARPLGLTFDYASPARRRGAPASTADDVYSLGVLLAELLQRFAPLPADLQAVVARARADREADRYASVDALQEDVQRWLNGLPVVAYGHSRSYVLRRFLARHRLAASIAAGAVLLLAGAALALALLYLDARAARRDAEQRFADARETARFMLFDVYDRLGGMPRSLTLRRDVAEAGQRYLDRLARDPRAPADVRLEVIEGLRRLAQVQGAPGEANLAQTALARTNLDRAEQLAAAIPADATNDRTRRLLLARVALARAILNADGMLDFTAASLALDRAQALVAGVPAAAGNADRERRELVLAIAVQRSQVLEWQGRYQEAIDVATPAIAEAAALRVGAVGEDSARAAVTHARALDTYAEALTYLDRPRAAVDPYTQQVAIYRELYERAPDGDVAHAHRLSRARWALGVTYLTLGEFTAAETALRAARDVAQSHALLDPRDRNGARTLEVATNAHAQALAGLKRYDEAIALLTRTRDGRYARWRAEPQNWQLARDYAVGHAMLADVRADAGRIAEACADYAALMTTFDEIRRAGKLSQMDEDNSVRFVRERIARHCTTRDAGGRSTGR